MPKEIHPYEVLRRPIVTEKSTPLAGLRNGPAALALAAVVVMLPPDGSVALGVAICVRPGAIYGTYCHRLIAPPQRGMESQPVGQMMKVLFSIGTRSWGKKRT